MNLDRLKNKFFITLGLGLVMAACAAVVLTSTGTDHTATLIMLVAAIGLVLVIVFQTREVRRLRAQFFEAQKMEAVGRLAGGIAHDFNNALAAISGFAELLAEDLKDHPEQQRYADNILTAAAQSQRLIDQILAFSRRSQGAPQSLRVTSICADVISMLKATLRPKITLATNIEAGEAAVLAIPGQIEQVIMNICVNAGDAIGKDTGKITLSAKIADKDRAALQKMMAAPGKGSSPSATLPQKIHVLDKKRSVMTVGSIDPALDYISITVEDTGGGIPLKTLESIFDPFFTTKATGKGTGLGLSAVHGIIAMNKGALIITTQTGFGTSFEILLPLTLETPSARTLNTATLPKQGAGHGHLLLVEDDAIVATMMITGLERMGYDVLHCQNGAEALEALKAETGHYSLVITDYKMPGMTGLDLALQVTKLYPALPIVMVSGYSEEKLESRSGGTSIRRVLKKPVRLRQLADCISEILGPGQS